MKCHAERCPVCFGVGYYTPAPDPFTSGVAVARPCHGCDGRGWVTVVDDNMSDSNSVSVDVTQRLIVE
jgi:hypothetical protein